MLYHQRITKCRVEFVEIYMARELHDNVSTTYQIPFSTLPELRQNEGDPGKHCNIFLGQGLKSSLGTR